MMAKPTIITTIMPATAGTKYMSAAEVIGASAGVGVDCAASTTNAVSACEGQYPPEPSNEA